jgi:hypothetical protein
MVTGQGYGIGIGRYNELRPTTTGLSLVALFSLSVSIEDRPLLWMVVRSQIYYPEHILTYESRKTCCSLVVGSGSFRTDSLEAGKGGSLSTTMRPGLKCGGLESKFGRGSRTLDKSEMDWFCLCLGYKRGKCFGVPNCDTLIRKSPFLHDGTTLLWSSTVVRTGI